MSLLCPMRILLLSLFIFFVKVNAAQFKFVDSCVQFNVKLKIINPLADTISYLYFDCEKNQGYRKRVALQNGELHFSGTVNRSDEIIFICNPNALFEDSSYYRLIVNGGTVSVELTMSGPSIINEITTGSTAQLEQQAWKKKNQSVLQATERYSEDYRKFMRSKEKIDSVERRIKMLDYQSKLDLLAELRADLALDYIRQNPDSYFSSAILWRYNRLFPADTIMKYFGIFSDRLQQSFFGKMILKETLSRSNNWQLFSNYLDSATFNKVKSIRSLYDISLPSLNGELISLSHYKGKIILFDFWASWCGPCISSIPAMNNLIDDMKNSPVVIIPVSVDSNMDQWKKAIQKNKYKGIQLLDQSSLLAAYYKILGYPTYVIIDAQGKLIDANAPTPNDGERLKAKLLEVARLKSK